MDNQKQLVLGIFGFGVVGEALYHALSHTPSLRSQIKKICIKHPKKKRNAPSEIFTTNALAILEDPEINTIVELIDDADAAYQIVKKSLIGGKHVVTANKKMIAENLKELIQLQQESGASLLYEAACCASIPVIRNLEEYYDNDLLHSILAIVNGSTNYILSKIINEKMSFVAALEAAQKNGFAESNPSLDVEGHDAANKWTFLLCHAYGINISTDKLLYTGIHNISNEDATIAGGRNSVVKLTAVAQKLSTGKIAAFVLPQFVKKSHLLASVHNEYNGVVIESSFADQQFFYGKGAGGFPTASAVLSDISALRYQYKYEYKKLKPPFRSELSDDFYLNIYLSFPQSLKVNTQKFIRIEEWHSNEERKYLVGIIHYKSLTESNWWKQKGVSLILADAHIIEPHELSEWIIDEAAQGMSHEEFGYTLERRSYICP